MRTKIFIINSIVSIVEQLVIAVSGFIIPHLLINQYGSELNGLVSSIMQFIGYFKLVEAGLGTASIFALYKPLATGDKETVNRILQTAKKSYQKSGFIFLTGVIVLSFVYPFLVKTTLLNFTSIVMLTFVLGFSGVLDFFVMAKYRVLLSADRKQYILSISSIVYTISYLVITFIMIKIGVSLLIFKTAVLSAVVGRFLILFLYTRTNYKDTFAEKNVEKYIVKQRWPAFIIQILGTTQSAFPIILATIFTSLVDVSIFSIYMLVSNAISGVLGIFMSSITSSFGEVISRGEQGTLKKSYNEFETAFYLIITTLFSVTVIMFYPFIQIYTKDITDIPYASTLLVVLVTSNAYLYNLKVPQGMLVMAAGKFQETISRAIIQTSILIGFGIILGLLYGLPGIIVASILSNLYRVIDLVIYVPKTITQSSPFVMAKKIVISFVIFFTSLVVSSFFTITNISMYRWIGYSAFFTIFIFAISILLYVIFAKKDIMGIFARLINIKRRTNNNENPG